MSVDPFFGCQTISAAWVAAAQTANAAASQPA
jgi:hypothetical protein